MQELRERFDAYRSACERERRRLARGPELSPRYAELDDRYADLTSGDPLDRLRKEIASGGSGEQKEAERRLLCGIEDAVVAARTRDVEGELRARARDQRVRAGAGPGNEAELRGRLAVSDDADERTSLEDALERASAGLAELRAQRFARVGAARRALGYPDGLAFLRARSTSLDPDAAEALLGGTLERSEPAFRDARARLLAASSSHALLLRARRAPELDRVLLADRHAAALDALCAPLGRRLEDVQGLALEPGYARADRFALEVPGDIRLALPGAGGLLSRVAAFAAAGRALHGAYTSSELSPERRRVSDPVLDEGFAWLIGLRALDREWLAELDLGAAAESLAVQVRFERVVRTRVAAALARIELLLARVPAGETPPADLEARFARGLEEATGVPWPGSSVLAHVGAEGRAVARMQGFALEALLAERLRSAHGRRFWREGRAWNLLRELWNTGATYDAASLGRELGFRDLDPTPFLDACAAL
jgi:hypothetical protein